MKKGTKHKPEVIEKIRRNNINNPRRYWLGKKRSEDTIKKISENRKGKAMGNKNRLGHPSWNKGKKHSEETKRKQKEAKLRNPVRYWKGKKRDLETKEKIRKKNIGRKLSEKTKEKMSLSRKGHLPYFVKYGKDNPAWKGDKAISPINKRIRFSNEYKLWRKSVFERDNYTCIFCGKRGGIIHADHIKPFSQYPELRFAIDNGRTLCIDCHRKTDTYGNKRIYGFG